MHIIFTYNSKWWWATLNKVFTNAGLILKFSASGLTFYFELTDFYFCCFFF